MNSYSLNRSNLNPYEPTSIDLNSINHFRDSNVYKEPEEYFPFGKPGGGAPYRDSEGKIISKRPGNQFNPSPDLSQKTSSVKPNANWTYDQQAALRDQKRDEWRRSLIEQVQAKDRIKQEEKEKALRQERLEEERLAQQRAELEEKYKKELKVEQGLPYEPEVVNVRSQAVIKEPLKMMKAVKDTDVQKENPQPVVKEFTQVMPKVKVKSLEFNPMKIEYWQARSELAVQHNSFKDVLAKLKYEADQAHIERNEAMMELDRFRELLRMRNVDNELKDQQRKMSRPDYGLKYKQEGLRAQFEGINRKTDENKALVTESRFVPLVNAGASVVGNSVGNSSLKIDYEEIDNSDVKDQLAELDILMNSNREKLY